MYEYTAVVDRVVDGDTVDLQVDLGFRIFNRERFRLLGIDTPERGQTGWAEATEQLRVFLPVGSVVVIHTQKPFQDKYGRWLATVFANAVNVNDAMVSGGFAKEYYP